MFELNDVLINKICFSQDGKCITLSFVDMYNGVDCAEIQCESIFLFNYHCISFPEIMPLYVGEIHHEILSNDELKGKLRELNFSFFISQNPIAQSGNQEVFMPDNRNLHFLHIEGGEVVIYILCNNINSKKID